MNRIDAQRTQVAPPLGLPLSAPAARTRLEAGRYSPAEPGEGIALFGPLHYEANYAYPLLVWLHGTGDSENQLQRIMPLVSLRNYVG